MRFRNTKSEREDIRLQMVPMIDIVFQLLVFFVLTFRPTVMEGDFNIRMPLANTQATPIDDLLDEPVVVELKSDANRNLSEITVTAAGNTVTWQRDEANPMGVFQSLNNFVIGLIPNAADPTASNELEAEIVSDYDLRYGETVKAIEAVSGYKDGDEIVKLIEKIKFRDMSQQ